MLSLFLPTNSANLSSVSEWLPELVQLTDLDTKTVDLMSAWTHLLARVAKHTIMNNRNAAGASFSWFPFLAKVLGRYLQVIATSLWSRRLSSFTFRRCFYRHSCVRP